MIHDAKVIYSEDGSYMVIARDFIRTDIYGPNIFIVHMEGTPKQLYKLGKEHYDELHKDRIFFCIKDKNYFGNHCEEILPGLFEYKRKKLK